MSTRRPTASEGDFLGRWSRLKRERAAEPESAGETATETFAEIAPGLAPDTAPEAAPPAEARTDAEILEDLGLPHPETLKPGDDFTAFMAKAVPEHLRRIALRKLWSSNPVLACLDGLNDYEEDYTDAAVAVKTLATEYRVGRGFRRNDEVDEDEGAAAAGAETVEADASASMTPGDDTAAADETGAAETGADKTEAAGSAGGDRPEAAASTEGQGPSASVRAPGEPVAAAESAAEPSPGGTAGPAETQIVPRRARMRFHQAD